MIMVINFYFSDSIQFHVPFVNQPMFSCSGNTRHFIMVVLLQCRVILKNHFHFCISKLATNLNFLHWCHIAVGLLIS